jgi:hypothetical protein
VQPATHAKWNRGTFYTIFRSGTEQETHGTRGIVERRKGDQDSEKDIVYKNEKKETPQKGARPRNVESLVLSSVQRTKEVPHPPPLVP